MALRKSDTGARGIGQKTRECYAFQNLQAFHPKAEMDVWHRQVFWLPLPAAFPFPEEQWHGVPESSGGLQLRG